MVSFIFDASKGETPAQLAKQREIAAALMMGNRKAPQNVGEGLNAIGQALIYRQMMGKANAAEQAGQAAGQERWGSIVDALGRGNFPAAPTPDGSVPLPETDMASARVAQAHGDNDIRGGIIQTASALGISPEDLATAISYETAGTFDPTKRGPTTQWGQHRGLIQFGEPQAKEHGVDWQNPVGSQLGPNGAVASYLRKAGVQPGMGMLDIYSAINAGRVGRYNASDANNGGAPGTVRNKVEKQMAGHRQKALALLGSTPSASAPVQATAGGLTPEMLQQWGANVYAPAQSNDAMAAVNALGTAAPVGVAESEEDILAQEMAMMGQDPQAFQQPQGLPQPQALMPATGTEPRLQPPAVDPAMAPGQPAMAPPQPIADMPVAAAADPRLEMSGNMDVPQPTGPTLQELAKALGDPWLPEEARPMVQALLNQQMQQQDPRYGMQLEADRLGLEKSRLELDAMRNPVMKPTDTQRNLEWRAQQAGLQPGTPAYQQFMMTGGDKGTNITVNTGEGDKFYENLDKKNAETFSALSEAGVSGRSKMAQIDRLDELLTRAPQGASAMLKQAAGEYGINTEGLSDIQAAQALINELVPQQRQPGSGPMSDADLALFKQSLPRLINQPDGNRLILDTMRNITRYQVQMGDIADLVADREISPAEGRKMIRELANPLGSFGENLKSLSSQDGGGSVPSGWEDEWEYLTPEERARISGQQ